MISKTATSTIWVYIDLRNERFLGFSLNALAKARELSQVFGGETTAILTVPANGPTECRIGDLPAAQISKDRAIEAAIGHGADSVILIEHPDFRIPHADRSAAGLAQVVKARKPKIVLFALSDFGRELAARTARLTHAGLIADCADLNVDNGKIVASCPSWGGEIMAQIAFSDGKATGFATVQPTIAKAVNAPGKPGSVETVRIEKLNAPKGIRLVDRRYEEPDQRRLEDADIVVVGGAGVGSAEGFGRIRELAAVLGGEVGATRPPVLQHWVDEKRLIGQTGKTVRPKLLFSVGTSGAVQYTAGIVESGLVVAVNRDGNAPIFSAADLALVADWDTVVPPLTDKIKQTVMRRLADGLCDDGKETGTTSFGQRICLLRESQGWSREALAQATDQSPEYVAQVEKDDLTPPVSFLLRLARALGVDPGTFLREEEKEAIRDQRTQAFIKRTQSYSYQTLTPDAETEHLRAFLVTIESRQTHKPVAYKHEGEEFVFIIEGELELTVGGKPHHLKPFESLRFNSDIPHKLKSLSDETTRCLVVLYTP
jgi:electron transfer flavoprotein alpha subunit/transcriptional regulator with XRE-family HTH domain